MPTRLLYVYSTFLDIEESFSNTKVSSINQAAGALGVKIAIIY